MGFTVKISPETVTTLDSDMEFSSIAIQNDSSTGISCMLADILHTEIDTTYENVNSLHEQENDVVVEYDKINGDYKSVAHLIPKVAKTYINGDTTIVKFADGTFTKAVCKLGDSFNPETGICICLFKKVLDRLVSGHGSSVYNKLMDYALDKGIEESKKKVKKGRANEKSRKA